MNIIDHIPEIDPVFLNDPARDETANILFTAVEYDVFSRLENPKCAGTISEEMNTIPDLTEKFLNVLTSLKVLQKNGNLYSNTMLSKTYLFRKSPFYQGNLFKLRMRGSTDWMKIKEALKSGGIKTETDIKDYIDSVFIIGHAEAAICGPLQKAVHAVSGLPEFENAKKILDLGGGHGLYALAFAQLNPDLEIVLFDLPHVTEMAIKYFKQYDLENRIKIIPGDFNKDDIGDGYDIVFASDITIDGILGKIYQALKDEGILIYRRWTLNDDKVSPVRSVLSDFNLSMNRSEYYIHTLNEYVEILDKIGLKTTRIIDIATYEDPTKIIIAKKIEVNDGYN